MRRIFLIINQGCLFRSCFNGGSCLPDKEKQTFLCSCLPLWTGDRCEAGLGNNYMLCLSLNSGKTPLKSIHLPAWYSCKPPCFDKSYPSLGDLLRRLQTTIRFLSKIPYNWKVV